MARRNGLRNPAYASPPNTLGPWGRAPVEDETEAEAEAEEAGASGPLRFPCPNCGATLSYAPGERLLVCGFCGTETPAPDAAFGAREALREHDYLTALREADADAPMEESEVLHCDSCGADIEFDPDQQAGACPFCAAPIVAPPRKDRHIRPQGLLPFALGERDAAERLKKWLSGLWFAPSGLRKYARSGKLVGVYVPWWTFDARTRSAYFGQRGDAYTRRVGAGKNARTITRIRWRPASGNVVRDFDDVTTHGSSSLTAEESRALGPFDLSNLEPYRRDWLAGFRAEAYSIGLKDAYGAARARMDEVIATDVRRSIGGDRQRILRVDTQVSEVRFKHVLLPIWIGAYRYRGKPYRVVVNGRSGQTTGERPWSVWKIALAVVAALIVAGGAAYLFAIGR